MVLKAVYVEVFRYHIRGIANQKGIEYLNNKIKKEKLKTLIILTNMNKKTLSVFTFIFSILMGVSAQDSMKISLNDAVAYGIVNANKIKLAQLTQEDAKKQVKETMAIGLPQNQWFSKF